MLTLLVTIIVIGSIIIISTPSVYSMFYTLGRLGFGTTHRVTLWQASIDQIVTNPLTGKGFALTVGDVMSGRDADFDTHIFLQNLQGAFNSHNYYLAVVLATGIPGLIILLWFLYKLYAHLYRCHKQAKNSRIRVTYAVLLATSLSVAVGFFFDTGSLMSTGSYANYYWIALGMAEAARRKNLFA
jgi:O-antigen ligase